MSQMNVSKSQYKKQMVPGGRPKVFEFKNIINSFPSQNNLLLPSTAQYSLWVSKWFFL